VDSNSGVVKALEGRVDAANSFDPDTAPGIIGT
jgi:hypothetical protein